VQGNLELGMRVRSHPVSLSRAQKEAERQEVLLARYRGDIEALSDEDEEVDPPDTPLLNSFIADDLAMVAGAVRAGDYGPARRTYLSSSRELSGITRRDIRVGGDSSVHRVFPELTPPGRWPAKDTHPLALSQQIAINSVVERLGE